MRAADSLDSDHGVFGASVPTERSHLRPNRFPEPTAYRQDRGLAERARELAGRVGLRQAARELGVSRDTLERAWEHWGMSQPEGKPGIPPSRFLADRADAERAFRLAEELGSVNAAARELGTTWPSLRKTFQRHELGMPRPNPRRSASARAPCSLRGAAPSGRPHRSWNRRLPSSTLAPCPERAGTPARRRCGCAGRRRSRPSAFGVVADMNRESRPQRPSVRHRTVASRAERAQQLAAERASRPVRRQAERAGRHERTRTERAGRSARPHHRVSYRDER